MTTGAAFGNESVHEKADRLLAQGRNNEAASLLMEHLKRTPDDHRALHMYGSALYRAGNYRSAEKIFRHMTQFPSVDFMTYYSLGLCLDELGRFDEGQDYYKAAHAANPAFSAAAEKIRAYQQHKRRASNAQYASPDSGGRSKPKKRGWLERAYDDTTNSLNTPKALIKWLWVPVVLWVVWMAFVLTSSSGVGDDVSNNQRYACERMIEVNGPTYPLPPMCDQFDL